MKADFDQIIEVNILKPPFVIVVIFITQQFHNYIS